VPEPPPDDDVLPEAAAAAPAGALTGDGVDAAEDEPDPADAGVFELEFSIPQNLDLVF